MSAGLILTLRETRGLARSNEFVQVGAPLPRGYATRPSELALVTSEDERLPAEIGSATCWPDGSLRWCHFRFIVSIEALGTISLRLERSGDEIPASSSGEDPVTNRSNRLVVSTRDCEFVLDTSEFGLFQEVRHGGSAVITQSRLELETAAGDRAVARVDDISRYTGYTGSGALYSRIEMAGVLTSSRDHAASPATDRFSSSMHFVHLSNAVTCSFRIHNPRPAKHPRGTWDLGDPGAFMLRSLSLNLSVARRDAARWKADQQSDWKPLEQDCLSLYQESSGGNHWNSPNHRNRDNLMPLKIPGFVVERDGEQTTGSRASPALSLNVGGTWLNCAIRRFWQNFPKAIDVRGDTIRLELFPRRFPDLVEIQPGESKTHEFAISLGYRPDELAWLEHPLAVELNSDWLRRSAVLPADGSRPDDSALHEIIRLGLDGEHGFRAKREKVDEYGWRNFGDLYADHETDLHRDDRILVSHYNNQYDPLWGFLHQYLATGEHEWFELADDLARHVADIDIYQTEMDRSEFNGGLFWHTDHYQDAGKATHRTYSELQREKSYRAHTGGGGPGPEHCYTQGLLYHYLLTGCETSRAALLCLGRWMINVHEGSGSLLELLARIRNRNDGPKNVVSGLYPLYRGTGNYLNTLLDCVELTRDMVMLKLAESVVRNTVHPLDMIEHRGLEDAESNWSYTVFLQALCRYLNFKLERDELDLEFYYGRDSLLRYADWMAENEAPYLENPDILEYPNQTWTAQDIRKVVVLRFAARLHPGDASPYRQKADYILADLVHRLAADPNRAYTRILAILMQGDALLDLAGLVGRDLRLEAVGKYERRSQQQFWLGLSNLGREFSRLVRQFSLSREIRWLTCRFEGFAQNKGPY